MQSPLFVGMKWLKKDTLIADPMTLSDYFKKYFKGGKIVSTNEAGFCGYLLHRHLVGQGN